ncbi:MAG: sugar porter family MFS transporter [Bacteroidota bacterium]
MRTVLIAVVVSLGGFLFGFDASVISGVIGFVTPQFGLSEIEQGWVVSSPTFAAIFAMFSGTISDWFGRRKILIFTAFLYALSAFMSALAPSYEVLVIARMIGGLAFGAALVLAPIYIGELAPADMRGKLVSIMQLNIVLGFSASYFSNFFILQLLGDGGVMTEETVWRWMLGVEFVPALLYLFLLFIVPKSPRWLIAKGRDEEALKSLAKLYNEDEAKEELSRIKTSLESTQSSSESQGWLELFTKPMKLILVLGFTLAIVQQITGINSILFYANTIFEQSGIGKNAAFAQAIWVGLVQVIFTIVTMVFIDRWGRRPLMLTGLAGIALSMLIVFIGFNNATYQLNSVDAKEIGLPVEAVAGITDQDFNSDVEFKRSLRSALGDEAYLQNESAILERSVTMNAWLILIGILGFMASFSLSVGPVMWVLFSEIFPARIKGIAFAVFGFTNSATSFLVQLVFPWEIANLGSALSYLIFGLFAVLGLVVLAKYLPETKGKSLEELEKVVVNNG